MYFFLVFLFCYNALTARTIEPQEELGQLCAKLAKFFLEDYDEKLELLTKTSIPTDVKVTRKAILALRDYLDICVFSYPDGDDDDKWLDIRELLDVGYTRVGDFQDLKSVDPTDEELEQLRDKCLDWKKKWDDEDDDHKYHEYIEGPKPHAFFDRKFSDLYGYYWKKTEKEPNEGDNAQQNLARLTKHMIEFEIEVLPKVEKIEDVTTLTNHDEFHDFRKVLRSITYISTLQTTAGLTGSFYNAGFNVQQYLDIIDITYDAFGGLNDRIYAYLHDVDNDVDKDKLKEEKEALILTWNDLRASLKDQGFIDSLNKLTTGLIPY